MNSNVDKYLLDGCMRCKLGGTPKCKVHNWRAELEALRQLVLECNLNEEVKWGVPCYTVENKNIVMISALKEYCCLSFLKGVLIEDHYNLLTKPGENSQVARYVKLTSVQQILDQWELLKSYIQQAIAIEKTGQKVALKKNPEPIPDELQERFLEDPSLEKAFWALTPGRQRGYIIYFTQPKQATSRFNRIDKCKPKILNGEGLHDKYNC
jgi:uncharacterized protein YdeI (YjbR/CyaY-like superfamily)